MAFTFQARQIRKSFGGVEVLHGVDLDACEGEVLALLGENGAGKSTLVKIMAGDYQADSGKLIVEEEPHSVLTPRQARALGVAIISQEFQDAPPLTVAENISLGRLPSRGGMVDWGAVRRRAVGILEELDVAIDPGAAVGSLRVGERQLVEIARALSWSARLLILDEPTAALSHHEAEVLFDFIRRLRAQGVAVVYITHRLDEVGMIADKVQVLRDGDTALLADAAEIGRRDLIEAMIGRKSGEMGRPPPLRRDPGGPVLRWTDAGAEGCFEGVSLEVRAGEVVAVYGKLGSGAMELAETAFGVRELDSGRLELDQADIDYSNPAGAVKNGVGYLPAERKEGGALMVRSVAENTAVASWRVLARFFGQWLTARAENRAYRRWHDRLSIRSRNDPRQIMRTLSGGNQQKVLISRWLERRSRVLVMVEPTRGVDVGARRDIYRALRELAEEGIAVLAVTSDYEEAVQVADRCLVVAKGRPVEELAGEDITMNRLLEASGG